MILLDTPTSARLVGYEAHRKTLAKALSYIDGRKDFELVKARRSLKRFEKIKDKLLDSWGEEKYEVIVKDLEDRIETLKIERKQCLLFEDQEGYWTYSGLAHRLASAGNDCVERKYFVPAPEVFAWAKEPRYPNRDYQNEATRLLLENNGLGPVGVELPTGSGKSTIIRQLIKELGLQTIVMAPSTSIAGQLYDDLVYHFGTRYVGMYGDGKHQFNKLITVGIDDSLTKIQPGDPAWTALHDAHVFIADESHLTPAESLQKVCFGLASKASYRFFVSATQMRNDGLDLVLGGITGRIVYRKTLRELVDAGYLAKPVFKMVHVRSDNAYEGWDANRMTREHLYYNPVLNKVAGQIANSFVKLMKRPTIILVEELEQFRELLPHFEHPVKFAHGPLTAATKKLVPEAYHADKPKALVEAFNRGEVPILVGTSCIATGTDIQVAEAGIYLMGKTSEIKLMQGVGRETRGGVKGNVFNPWTGKQKVDCVHVDFKVVDVPVMERHADERAKTYEVLYDKPTPINMTHVLKGK